jgi:hypothetical protein
MGLSTITYLSWKRKACLLSVAIDTSYLLWERKFPRLLGRLGRPAKRYSSITLVATARTGPPPLLITSQKVAKTAKQSWKASEEIEWPSLVEAASIRCLFLT